MKRAIFVAIVLCAVAVNSSAQRGPVSGGNRNAGMRGNPSAPPLRPVRPVAPMVPGSSLGGRFSTSPRIRGRGFSGFPYGGFLSPWDDSSYFPTAEYANDYTYQPAAQTPNVVVMMPPVPLPPPPPPPAAKPALHEYNWPDTSASRTSTFSVATKRGAVYSATAVWVQDGFLYLITADNKSTRVPLDSIERDKTNQMNAGKGLSFWLPPESER
jgi:hypothetical protein